MTHVNMLHALLPILEAHTSEVAEQLNKVVIPFTVNRGTLRAEESLFSWVSSTEGFLTSFGMTTKGTFSATSLSVRIRGFIFP